MTSYQACENRVCSLPALRVISHMASLGFLATEEEESLRFFLCRVAEERKLCHAEMWKLEDQGIQLSKEIITLGHLKRAISSIGGNQSMMCCERESYLQETVGGSYAGSYVIKVMRGCVGVGLACLRTCFLTFT